MTRMAGTSAALSVVLGALACGCVQDDPTRNYLVSEPRILAVLAEPAEALPGDAVHFRAVWVDRSGPVVDGRVRWSFCVTPRALSENTPVSRACASTDEAPLSARTLELDTRIPRDACARFGTETALGMRPADPDHSGGYYQPLRVSTEDLTTSVVRARILCPLANAPIDVARRFNEDYVPNAAPSIVGLTLSMNGEELAPDALPAEATVTLQLSLGDDARERYLRYSARSGELDTLPEVLSAEWFVTRGELDQDQAEIRALTAENVLSTPEPDSELWLWIVVRDDRGGVSIHEQVLHTAR